MRSTLTTLGLSSLLVAGIALAATAPAPRLSAPKPPATGAPAVTPLGKPTLGSESNGDAARIHDLDQQLKALRDQFHAALDPLQAQIKELHEKFDPQIKSLEDQRHDLVEAGKSPMVQDLDKQEAAEIATLADQEKSEIERVHQHYADARKATREKYDQLRAGLKNGAK